MPSTQQVLGEGERGSPGAVGHGAGGCSAMLQGKKGVGKNLRTVTVTIACFVPSVNMGRRTVSK